MKSFSKLLSFFILLGILSGSLSALLYAVDDYPYDPNAEVDYSLTNTNLFGYRIILIQGYPFIYFRDQNQPVANLAQYNWQRQFWLYKSEGFDSSGIQLEKFFKKIDLSKTLLDRPMPQVNQRVTRSDSEKRPYDDSKDADFKAFMTYLKNLGTPEETVNFYLSAANHPAKRGKSLPFEYGAVLSPNEVGLSAQNFKLIQYKGLRDGDAMRKTPMITAGGMQLFFEMAKGNYVLAVDTAYNIFTDHDPVPVTIVELEPLEKGKRYPILRGKALRNRVALDLKKFFKKDFSVRLITEKISYTELADTQGLPLLTHLDRFFEKKVNQKVGQKSLIIYYFTDVERLRAMDDEMAHPLIYGPYGTDWNRYFATIIHEMGHSLGITHHFGERENASDLGAHISPACVMNYRFKADRFCELCLYGLKIVPKK